MTNSARRRAWRLLGLALSSIPERAVVSSLHGRSVAVPIQWGRWQGMPFGDCYIRWGWWRRDGRFRLLDGTVVERAAEIRL